MKIRDSSLKSYVREQLAAGQFAPVLLECRAEGLPPLMVRSELHTHETMRERQLLDSIPARDQFTTTAINPASGLFGVYQVFPANRDIPGESEEANLQNSSGTIEKAEILSKKILEVGRVAEDIARRIANGTIQDFGSLTQLVPHDMDEKNVLTLVASMRKPVSQFETGNGQYTTGGHIDARTTLPSRTSVTVIADIHYIDETKNGKIGFEVIASDGGDSNFADFLRGQRMTFAELDTPNNKRTMALIYFSRLHGASIKLELLPTYIIADQQWSLQAVNVLMQDELLSMDRPARQLFEDY